MNELQSSNLFTEIRLLIDSTKAQVASTVNSAMTMMYWNIGDRINRELLGGERAAYGRQVVVALSRQLTDEYGGREFSEKNLNRMRLFASRFSDRSIWTSLMSKLSWSHFLQVIPIEDELARNFYLTKLPERSVLETKLQQAIQRAHNRLKYRDNDD